MCVMNMINILYQIDVCNEYDKYTISRGASYNREIMANIMLTGSEGVWR